MVAGSALCDREREGVFCSSLKLRKLALTKWLLDYFCFIFFSVCVFKWMYFKVSELEVSCVIHNHT